MEFYRAALGATETYRVPGGGVGELDVRGARFWVAEESPENLNFSPETLGGCSVRMLLMVDDPTAMWRGRSRLARTQVVPVECAMVGSWGGLWIRLGIIGRLGGKPRARAAIKRVQGTPPLASQTATALRSGDLYRPCSFGPVPIEGRGPEENLGFATLARRTWRTRYIEFPCLRCGLQS